MATDGTEIHVRYNPVMAWVALAIGAVNTALGLLFLFRTGGPSVVLVLGPILVALGIRYLTGEFFIYRPRTRVIELIAPIGTRRRFQPKSGEKLVVNGGRIVLVQADRRKKLPVTRLMSLRTDWDAVTAAITADTP